MKIPQSVLKQLDKKQHKYHAIRSTCLYGHNHDSRKEAMWCVKLHELEKEGKITLLIREPKVVLKVWDTKICCHYPDFMFFDQVLQRQVILDVKGIQLREWKNKKKLCEACYPNIEYRVV